MSKYQQTFRIQIDSGKAISLCQEVAVDLGWRVLEVSNSSISVKEVAPQLTGFTWPARIDVQIGSISSQECELRLFGSILGVGPIQRNHLQGQMGRFLNHLSVLVDRPRMKQGDGGQSGTSLLSEELTRLKELVDEGVLTQEEFAAAKARLLER